MTSETEPADRRTRIGRGFDVFVAVVVIALPATAILLQSWLYQGMKCDDVCANPHPRHFEPREAWTRYASSWQWDAQFVPAIAGFLAAMAAVRYIKQARLLRAGVAVVLALIFSGGWLVWHSAWPR